MEGTPSQFGPIDLSPTPSAASPKGEGYLLVGPSLPGKSVSSSGTVHFVGVSEYMSFVESKGWGQPNTSMCDMMK